jgi:cytochrome c oxidase subunit 2
MDPRNTLGGLALVAGLSLAGAAAAAGANGQQVYADNCASCHQPTGEGRPPVFPALKGDKVALGPKPPLLALVLNGKAAMPPWKSELTDDEIAAAVSYVRQAWGNKAPPVTAAEVAQARAGR